MFETSSQTDTSTCRRMQAVLAQGGIITPVLFSPYVNDMPSLFRHVELALYAEDTAVIAMFLWQALLIKYLGTYLSDLEWWLSKWSTAMLFAKAGRSIPKPRPVQLFGDPLLSVDTVCFLGVTLDTRLTWSTHIDQVRKKAA